MESNPKKPHVLFETEGSYPFSGGGVSTWAHILCSRLEKEVDFTLFAITGNPFVEPRYRLTPNVKNIVHVPLWGVEEPVEYYDSKVDFSRHVEKKGRTTEAVIRRLFLPLFSDFLEHVFDPYRPAHEIGDVIYGFWKFFERYDYKVALRNPYVWSLFKQFVIDKLEEGPPEIKGDEPKVLDLTFGMRWIYHFMMPIASPIPKEITVCHATLAGFPALSSIAAKYEYGIPGIVTDHGVYMRERLINLGNAEMPYFSKRFLTNLSTFVSRAVYGISDVISPVTRVNTKWELKYNAPEERIQPIYNGVDTNLFVPAPKPLKTENTPTVIAVAQVFPLKDIETMIQSAALVKKQIPNVQFIVYGSLDVDKDYVEKCRALVSELNLEETFTFGGFHNQPNMIFNEGDISILTSISEGFPYTVIESMSCGRPVVATDVGGIREALEGCGILCKPRDPQDIANGVITLLQDVDMRLEMGSRARERVLLNYTIEKSVKEYYDVYNRLTNAPRVALKENVRLNSVIDILKETEGVRDAKKAI